MVKTMHSLRPVVLGAFVLFAACAVESAPPPPPLPVPKLTQPIKTSPEPALAEERELAAAKAAPDAAVEKAVPSPHAEETVQNVVKLARPQHPLLGAWRCRFDDYPPMGCTISRRGKSLRLDKTQGSQRIRGTLQESADGLTFQGEFFCPTGACTSSATAQLRKTDNGFAGTILHDQDGTPMRTPLVLTR